MKKLLAATLVGAILIGALSACGNGTAASSAAPDSTAASQVESSAQSDEASGSDEGGVIKIGVPGPYTAPQAQLANSMKYGTEYAIDEINKNGGILGKQLEAVYIDTEGKVETAIAAYLKLINDEKVDAIVGETDGFTMIGVLPTVAEANIPTIYSVATSNDFGRAIKDGNGKYDMAYTLQNAPYDMCRSIPMYLEKLMETGEYDPGEKKMAIVCEDSDWGQSVAQAYRDFAAEDDWNVVMDEQVTVDTTDFTTICSKIKSIDPDLCVFEFSNLTPAAALEKSYAELQMDALVIGGYYMQYDEFNDMVGSIANKHLTAFSYLSNEVNGQFREDLQSVHPDCQVNVAGLAYDAVYVYKEAVERAGSVDKQAVIDELPNTDFKGVLMRTVFEPETHYAKTGPDYKMSTVTQYMDGEFIWLFPDQHKKGDFVR